MREIDDAHDAEDEVQTEPDEAEIQAVQQPGEHGVEEHAVKHGRQP